MSKNATVLAFCGAKGGNQKSTTCINFGAGFLAHHGKKVLIIDLDYQHDSTNSLISSLNHDPLTYYHPTAEDEAKIKKASVFNIFKHQATGDPYPINYQPLHINKNVDLIPATENLDQVTNLFMNKATLAPYALISAFSDLKLPEKYDYILCDCHNSFTTSVQNALACADYIISPINPSDYSTDGMGMTIRKIQQVKNLLIFPGSHKSFVTGKILFIGTLIKRNTQNGRQFLKAIKGNPDSNFVALIPDRELFNRATSSNIYDLSIAEAKAKHNYRDLNTVRNQINLQYNKLYNAITQKEHK